MTDDGYRTIEALNSIDAMASFNEFERGYTQPLIDWAISGDCHATGYQSPSKREPVPPKWWEFLILDPYTDSATGLDIKIAGLRWHFDAPPEPEQQAPAKFKSDVETLYAAHVDETMKQHGHKPTFEEDHCWCKRHRVTRDRMRALRKANRTDEEKKGGPPRKLGGK